MKGVFSRGQVSIEYLLITAFAFFFILPIIIVFYTQSHNLNEEITDSQIDKIASEIVDAANEVFYLGEPSKKTLVVYMPQRVKSITLIENRIEFNVSSRAGVYQIVKWSVTNITGTLPTFSGIHRIEIEARLLDVLIQE